MRRMMHRFIAARRQMDSAYGYQASPATRNRAAGFSGRRHASRISDTRRHLTLFRKQNRLLSGPADPAGSAFSARARETVPIAYAPDPSSRAASASAADGYQNALAGLGESSPLLSSGAWVRSGLTTDVNQLTTLYRESWLAKRIIDMPSEDMTRAWIRITTDLAVEDMHLITRAMKTHNLRKELTAAL